MRLKLLSCRKSHGPCPLNDVSRVCSSAGSKIDPKKLGPDLCGCKSTRMTSSKRGHFSIHLLRLTGMISVLIYEDKAKDIRKTTNEKSSESIVSSKYTYDRFAFGIPRRRSTSGSRQAFLASHVAIGSLHLTPRTPNKRCDVITIPATREKDIAMTGRSKDRSVLHDRNNNK